MTIICLNIIIFIALKWGHIFGSDSVHFASIALGYVPAVAHDTRSLPESHLLIPSSWYALNAISSAFIHADIFHLGGNMLFLWVFGDNVEDAMGHIKYLIFYLLCAFVAAWFHAFVFPSSEVPLIGASGAAAGIVAAYLMLHPKTRVWVLFLGRIPLRLHAIWLLSGWIAYQVFMFIFSTDSLVSWAAHVGGIGAGIALVVLFKRKDIALFDRDLKTSPSAISPPLSPPETTQWGRIRKDHAE